MRRESTSTERPCQSRPLRTARLPRLPVRQAPWHPIPEVRWCPHRRPMAAPPRGKRYGNQEVRNGGQGRTDSRSESGQTSEAGLPEGRESAQADSSQSNHRHADFRSKGEAPRATASRRPGRGFPGPDRADSEPNRPNFGPNRRRGPCGSRGCGGPDRTGAEPGRPSGPPLTSATDSWPRRLYGDTPGSSMDPKTGCAQDLTVLSINHAKSAVRGSARGHVN